MSLLYYLTLFLILSFSDIKASEEVRTEVIRKNNEHFLNAIDDDTIKSCHLNEENFCVFLSKNKNLARAHKIPSSETFQIKALKENLEDLKDAADYLCASYKKLMSLKYQDVTSFTSLASKAFQAIWHSVRSLQTLITVCNNTEKSLKEKLFEELENMMLLIKEEEDALLSFIRLLAAYASTYYVSNGDVKILGDAIIKEYSFLQKYILNEDSPKRKLTGKEMLEGIIKMIDEKSTGSFYVEIMEMRMKDILDSNKFDPSKTPQPTKTSPQYLKTLNELIAGTWWFQNNISMMDPNTSLLGKDLSESRITSCLSKIEQLHTQITFFLK